MQKMKVIKDVTYMGEFDGVVVNVDYYNSDDCIAGYCPERKCRVEFGIHDKLERV